MHWSFIENSTLFVSLDIETGGTLLSFFVWCTCLGQKNQQPTTVQLWDTFDEYVYPGENDL